MEGTFTAADGTVRRLLTQEELDEWIAHDMLTADELEFAKNEAGL